MVERPVKIGDIVEIEGVTGTVSSVGARCVIITTFSHVDVLVPNSKLMQNTLINWTLSDSAVRYQVEVTIPRKPRSKFNPQDFIEDLEKMISELDVVIKESAPEVNLTQIKDSSLTFLLNFYCDVEHIQNLEYIKSVLNLALFDHLQQDNFTVEYLKVVDLKAYYPYSFNEAGDK